MKILAYKDFEAPSKQKLKELNMIKKIFIILAISFVLVSTTGYAQEMTADKILKRMNELAEESQNTKDMNRFKEIAKEMGKLWEAYTQAIQRSGKMPPQSGFSPPSLEEEKARQKKMADDLKHRSDEPCYPVIHQKEYARRYVGSDLPWVSCVPLHINLNWEVEERWIRTDKWPTGIVTYTLEENYPGYLQLIYDQKTRRKLEHFTIDSPSPQKDDRIGARITRGQANGLLAEAYGTPNEYKTVGTNDPTHFLVESDSLSQGVTFNWDKQTGALKGYISSSSVKIPGDRVVKKPFHLRYGVPKGVATINMPVKIEITPEELEKGLKQGTLTKTFPLNYVQDFHQVKLPEMYEVSGKVRLEIIMNPESALSISPSDVYKSSGPDKNGNFTPSSKKYFLKNKGNIPLEFKVQKTADWLSLNPVRGVIPPKATKTVTLSINSSKAKNLQEGTYKDTVTFINLTSGSGTTSCEVELTVGEEQTWQITIKGYDIDEFQAPNIFKDTDGIQKKLYKRVKFDWYLKGQFIIKKKKKQWKYQSGIIKAATMKASPAFFPSNIYKCLVVKCPPPVSAPISNMVGMPLFGYVYGKNVGLHWSPRTPSACLKCLTTHPGFPKTPFESTYRSGEFTIQIGLEEYPLKNGWSKPFKKSSKGVTWLYYTVTMKRLK
jgi:hypothetical protein